MGSGRQRQGKGGGRGHACKQISLLCLSADRHISTRFPQLHTHLQAHRPHARTERHIYTQTYTLCVFTAFPKTLQYAGPYLTKSLQPWLSPSTMLASSFLALTMMTGTTASGTVLRSSVQNSCPAVHGRYGFKQTLDQNPNYSITPACAALCTVLNHAHMG